MNDARIFGSVRVTELPAQLTLDGKLLLPAGNRAA